MELSSGTKPLVMIVEDNPLIVEFVEAHLRREELEVVIAESCQEAITQLGQRQPDLILVDVVLDDGLGYDLVRNIRSGGCDGSLSRFADIPIVMLTARADEEDRLEGFRAGADDYVTKPFSPEELMFRIKAILRRSLGVSSAMIELGSLQIDPRKREVLVNYAAVELTPKEFDLLHLLASNVGKVYGREDLLERVWGYSFLGNTRTVDVHVNRLRQKLAAAGLPEDIIGTEWGVGYKLVPPTLVAAPIAESPILNARVYER